MVFLTIFFQSMRIRIFPSVGSPLVSFVSALQFSEYRCFTSLVKLIPRYRILFDAIMDWIIFFVSLPDSLLIVCYRNNNGFRYINFISCNSTELVC